MWAQTRVAIFCDPSNKKNDLAWAIADAWRRPEGNRTDDRLRRCQGYPVRRRAARSGRLASFRSIPGPWSRISTKRLGKPFDPQTNHQ